MKIVHVGWGIPSRYITAGPVYYLHELAKVQQKKHQLKIFVASDETIKDLPAFSQIEEYIDDICYLKIINRNNFMYNLANPLNDISEIQVEKLFNLLLVDFEPDIIHFHNLIGLGLSLIEISKKKGFKNIITLNNYWFFCPKEDLLYKDLYLCTDNEQNKKCCSCLFKERSWALIHRLSHFQKRQNYALNVLSDFTDKIIVLSQRQKSIISKFLPSEQKILVKPLASRTTDKLTLLKKNRETSYPIIFSYYGAISPRKGLHIILAAFEELEDIKDKFIFKVWGSSGDQKYIAKISSQIENLRNKKMNLLLKGGYTQEDLPEILQEIDLLLIPSLWEETGPLTYLEALSARVPVIGSRTGSMLDFTIENKNGLLFEIGNTKELAEKIRYLIENITMIDFFRKNLPEIDSIEQHADFLLKIYQKL